MNKSMINLASKTWRDVPVAIKPASSLKEIERRMKPYFDKNNVKRDKERATEQYENVLWPLGFDSENPQTIRGKRFLELGCGSVFSKEPLAMNNSPPWLCRCLYEAGARVVGIDIEPQAANEKFMSYSIDLSKKGALSFIPDRSFDIVTSFFLLDFESDVTGGSTSPTLKMMNRGENKNVELALSNMMKEMLSQAHRILEIGGKLAAVAGTDLIIFEKQACKNKLVLIREKRN